MLAHGAIFGSCGHESLLRNKRKAFASVGIALSAIRGRSSLCMQSPKRGTFVGPSGGRVRGLLLILQVSVEVFHGGYSCDPSSTGAAPSSEGNLALGSGGKPASEQAVVDPIAGKNCRPLLLKPWISKQFHKGVLNVRAPSPPILFPWWYSEENDYTNADRISFDRDALKVLPHKQMKEF